MLTAGTALQQERTKKGYSLEEVAAATKINKDYLSALENDEFQKFPSSVYAKGFLQSYAKFLEIDVEKILALYRRSIGETASPEVIPLQKTEKQPKFVITPGIIVITFITIVVMATVGYLIYSFYNFQKPPALDIISPERNAVFEESDVTIKGQTDPGMFVTINDEPVRVETNGTFEAAIALRTGSNTVIVKVRHPDNIGKEAVVTLNLEYNPPADEVAENDDTADEDGTDGGDESTDQIEEMTVLIEVGPQNAWLEVEVDSDQLFSSVAPAGMSYTYTAKESLYIRTGKVTSTTLTINDETRDLIIEGGGVASILCELKDNEINCRQP